jgi:hypothetical protein
VETKRIGWPGRSPRGADQPEEVLMDADNTVVALFTIDEARMLQGLVSAFRLDLLVDLQAGVLLDESSHRADLAMADGLSQKLRGPEWKINQVAEKLAVQLRGVA